MDAACYPDENGVHEHARGLTPSATCLAIVLPGTRLRLFHGCEEVQRQSSGCVGRALRGWQPVQRRLQPGRSAAGSSDSVTPGNMTTDVDASPVKIDWSGSPALPTEEWLRSVITLTNDARSDVVETTSSTARADLHESYTLTPKSPLGRRTPRSIRSSCSSSPSSWTSPIRHRSSLRSTAKPLHCGINQLPSQGNAQLELTCDPQIPARAKLVVTLSPGLTAHASMLPVDYGSDAGHAASTCPRQRPGTSAAHGVRPACPDLRPKSTGLDVLRSPARLEVLACCRRSSD